MSIAGAASTPPRHTGYYSRPAFGRGLICGRFVGIGIMR